MSTQTNICDMCVMTTTMNQRLSVLEQCAADERVENILSWSSERVAQQTGVVAVVQTAPTSAAPSRGVDSGSGGVSWCQAHRFGPSVISMVVKEDRRLKHASGKGAGKPGPRQNTSKENKHVIVGSSVGGKIKVIKSKLVSVFAAKFCPELMPDTLAEYLKEKLH